mgnify:CR=1 FL=1
MIIPDRCKKKNLVTLKIVEYIYVTRIPHENSHMDIQTLNTQQNELITLSGKIWYVQVPYGTLTRGPRVLTVS